MSELISCSQCNQSIYSTESQCPHCGAFLSSQNDFLEQPMTATYGAPPWERMEISITDIQLEPKYSEQKEQLKKELLSYLEFCDKSVFFDDISFQVEFSVLLGKIFSPSFPRSKINSEQKKSISEALNNQALQVKISGKTICTVSIAT